MTNTATTSNGKLNFLRVAALLAAIGSLISPLLATGPLSGSGPLHAMHGMVGNLNFVLALVASIGGILWGRASGNKGLMFHALSLPLLAVIQIALGQMHLTMVHIVLGFAYLLAAVALFTLALRKPRA
ncbi:hypothetical protein ET989_11285 [Propioniciclava sinopodophylli]|uniref:Uncharacterized protein n=1 Tax=Propioniciclava sinopodophylli TaxID=1837344 RepID=A0A4Q9KCW7_9ACTN|nr:hypothetical protein [Propioniciclava sinopodophylli]TBT83532.1 hypothetical protein ET989_11285 [Propioniciclava sinopodophylli]